MKIVDSSTFLVSTTIAAAEVTIEPGAMRELHVSARSLLFSLYTFYSCDALAYQEKDLTRLMVIFIR